jgi:hypothetical protein
MLPLKLRDLCSAFCSSAKDFWPYSFVNKVPLKYSGKIPAYKNFKDMSKTEYKIYCKQFKNKEWNLF